MEITINNASTSSSSLLPHLLRRLNYLNEKYLNLQWSIKFQQVLYQAISLKKKEEFDSEKYNRKRMSLDVKFLFANRIIQ